MRYSAVCALAMMAAAPQDKLIKDWKIQITEINPETRKQEVVGEIRVRLAKPIDIKKEIIEATGVEGEYYTEPKVPGEKSEKISFRAEKGRLNTRRRLNLSGGVRIQREEDAATLETESAVILFDRKFECRPCSIIKEGGGKCPKCGKGMNERTFTSVEVDKKFVLKRAEPYSLLTGVGLHADDVLRELRVRREGVIEFLGSPESIAGIKPDPAAPGDGFLTRMLSTGPLVVRESGGVETRVLVRSLGGVRIEREDAQGRIIVTADTAELSARRPPKVDGKAPRPVIERIIAQGNIKLVDGSSRDLKASADSLTWSATEGASGVLERATLTGKPFVSAENGPYTIKAKRAILERLSGMAFFEDEVTATLVPKDKPDAPPIVIRSDKLNARMEPTPEGRRIREVEATGNVRLGGIEGKAGAGSEQIEAERFHWDLAEERGVLQGRPFVRLVRDRTTILAPLVVLEGRSIQVLKGPKRIHIVQPKEGGGEATIVVASEGDIEINSSGGKRRIILASPSQVRTDEFHLAARRMEVTLASEGGEIEELTARGEVRAIRLVDDVSMYGEHLRYEPSDQSFTLTGVPHVVAEARGQILRPEQIRIFKGPHPLTGVETVFTQLRGGKHGIRIQIRGDSE